jgi:hypothetical protein
MHRWNSFPGLFLILVILCPITGLAQDPAAPDQKSDSPDYEKRVLFEPLQVPSVARDRDQPTLFLPALFRPPVPWLKIDDRYESFVSDVKIQAELKDMEQLFLNPYSDLGNELTAGIQTEIGAYGEMVKTYKFGGGRFEFSSSAGPFGRPGGWSQGYDYDSWLGNSTRSTNDQ